jgi:hypothetical protein
MASSPDQLWQLSRMTVGRFEKLLEEVSFQVTQVRLKTVAGRFRTWTSSNVLRELVVSRVSAVLTR